MFSKDKRGISPLIATVLIIGFTVILAFIIITWINSNVSDLTCEQSCNADGGNACQGTITDLEITYQPYGYDGNLSTPDDENLQVVNLGDTAYDFVVVFTDSSGATMGEPITGLDVEAYGTFNLEDANNATYESPTNVRVIPTVVPVAPSGCDSCGNFECAAIEKTV